MISFRMLGLRQCGDALVREGGGVAPRASGLAASAGDHLQGSNCSKVTLEGAFQDFSLFVYIWLNLTKRDHF